MINKPLLSILMLTVGLAACGGSDDAPAPAPAPVPPPVASNEVPASATASVAAYSQYAGAQAASEVIEPLDVDKVVPPTSESDEPIDVA